MKNLKGLLIILFLVISKVAFGQLEGSEQTASVSIYKGIFYVHGDKDTYYPVVFKYGDQNKINHLRIYRSYNWPGPTELSATHRGGLSLEIDANYGSWGGIAYDWRIMDLRQSYHNTFAGAMVGMHGFGFIVWLRGGGFKYYYESEKAANLHVAYSSSEITFNNSNPAYVTYAPSPKTTIDWNDINLHKNDHWDFIKDKSSMDLNNGVISSGNLQISGDGIHYISNGNVGIGTTETGTHKLAVEGTIGAREIKVEAGTWSDFVFNKDYELKNLEEVENFIAENNHLPEIPSEKEVLENGVNLGEMDAKLLQKIEELTLYMIDLNKKVGRLENENELLKKKINIEE